MKNHNLSELTIRSVTENDIPLLLNLKIENTPDWNRDHYIHEIKSENSFFYLAELEEEIAGYISVQFIRGEIHLNTIGITSTFRRYGIAGRLLDFIIHLDFNEPPFVILLEVAEKNLAAIAFYKKKGFTINGRRKKYYDNDDALLMQKELV